MKRRALLASLGAATAVTAGCLTSAGSGSDPGGDVTDDPGTDDTTTDNTPTDTVTPTDGQPPEDPFADADCPSFATDVDRTVCWHDEDATSQPVYLDATTAVFEPESADDGIVTMSFVLHNQSTQSFGLNPYDWSIRQRTGDGWTLVAPDAHVEPWTTIEAGGTYTWALAVQPHPSPNGDDYMSIVEDLEDGTYAFEITGAFGDGPESGKRVECIAQFEVRRS